MVACLEEGLPFLSRQVLVVGEGEGFALHSPFLRSVGLSLATSPSDFCPHDTSEGVSEP